ncbi:mutator type transposase [Tanacetum coccineum]
MAGGLHQHLAELMLVDKYHMLTLCCYLGNPPLWLERRTVELRKEINAFDDLNQILEESEQSKTKENDANGSDVEDLEDLDYDLNDDEWFVDDDHIVEDVHVSMNHITFNPDITNPLSLSVEVVEQDLDVMDYDSFGSELNDGIDPQRKEQLRELRRTSKEKNHGQILTAVEVDGNNGIYLVAYVIVKAEINASWCWFLKLLGEDLGIQSNYNFTFNSDRHKVCIQAITKMFPSVEHMLCLKHVHENMKLLFRV